MIYGDAMILMCPKYRDWILPRGLISDPAYKQVKYLISRGTGGYFTISGNPNDSSNPNLLIFNGFGTGTYVKLYYTSFHRIVIKGTEQCRGNGSATFTINSDEFAYGNYRIPYASGNPASFKIPSFNLAVWTTASGNITHGGYGFSMNINDENTQSGNVGVVEDEYHGAYAVYVYQNFTGGTFTLGHDGTNPTAFTSFGFIYKNQQYVPCRRIADNFCGFYNLSTNTFLEPTSQTGIEFR